MSEAGGRGLERKLGGLCRAATVYMVNYKMQSKTSLATTRQHNVLSNADKYEPFNEDINSIKQVEN